ncbi:hypothetical protein E3T55_08375 [Cryobacterium frigoriphilum]|uniref:Uncharacterized protein n=1 Tax=Cryobacterium frigoriphilum TaxID=1259150 RepID=A0A4R9A2J5_9MICO|nr:DUF6541 family protein [Cryobacterium frigoriphilum]TFD50804.1 hypothetical protein E3T55_08375 [Cryobacterium frigoriphilum]
MPVFLVTIGLLFVPGLLIGLALGARRLTLIALAPAFTTSVLAVTALANQFVPFRWGVVPVLVTAVVIAAVVFGAALLWRSRLATPVESSGTKTLWLAGIAGLVFAFVAIGRRFMDIVGEPNHISQTFDNVFHLNAIAHIMDTGQASPLLIGTLSADAGGKIAFYPDIWHTLVALAADLSGATIPVAITVVNMSIAGLVWPLACMFLVRRILGPRPVALLLAGVLSAGFAAFPYLMIDFGVLYPNLLSLSLLPTALAVVVMIARIGAAGRLPLPALWVALIGILPGMALTHPSTPIALIAFGAPIAVAGLVRHFQGLRRLGARAPRYLFSVALALAALALAVVALLVVRPSMPAAFWPPRESIASAVLATVNNSVVGRPADWVIAALLLLGVWAMLRGRTHRWLVGSFLIAAALYVICASFPVGVFRYGFTGTWYSDSFRLAALMPVVVLPLAVAGLVWLVDAVSSLAERRLGKKTDSREGALRPRSRTGLAATVASAVAVVAVAVATQTGSALAFATGAGQDAYTFTAQSPLLSPNEATLLDRLDDNVPEDELVAGSPWTGASLVYALSGQNALLPAILGDRDANTIILMQSLRDADTNPAVCPALDALDVSYVLDFGEQEVHGAIDQIGGFANLETSSAVELVDREGTASLYRVTACD